MKKTILAFLVIPFLSACQKDKQYIPTPTSPSSPSVPASNGKEVMQGPSDGGGGDTCNGKMIESYKVDILKLEEFKDFIQPLFARTTTKEGNSSVGGLGLLSPQLKNWYIIDCKLQDIPQERKGLYLETYQMAIHTSREIFIDAKAYNKMEKEEKAKLLLHEITMSLYLIKYLTIEDLCKLSQTCSGDFSKVTKWKMFRPEAYRPLNKEDHQKIRNVTAWLWENRETLTPQTFIKLLKDNDFDKRLLNMPNEADGKNQEVEMNLSTLVRMFKKHQWAQSFPKFCQFENVNLVSLSTCHTEMTTEIRDYPVTPQAKLKQLYIKIKIIRDSDKKEFAEEFSYPLNSEDQKIKLYMTKIGSFVKAAPFVVLAKWPNQPGMEAKEGLKSHCLFFMLSLDNPENPEIVQLLYQTYVWYSFENQLVEREGQTSKETYGYATQLPEETEDLFTENEVPFEFTNFFQGKQFIKSETTVK